MKLWIHRDKKYRHLAVLDAITKETTEETKKNFYSFIAELENQNTIWAIAHKATMDFLTAKQIINELLKFGIISAFYFQDAHARSFTEYGITDKGFQYLFRLRRIKELLSGK